MRNIRPFYVINNMYNRYEKYDIMPRLENVWNRFVDSWLELQNDPEFLKNPDEWWKYPETDDEIKEWVIKELRYMFWGKCEYEMILSSWPYRHLEDGTPILKSGEYKKIDVFEQAEMNIDLIVQLFKEDIYFKK